MLVLETDQHLCSGNCVYYDAQLHHSVAPQSPHSLSTSSKDISDLLDKGIGMWFIVLFSSSDCLF